jgi:hypothetical protein
MSKDLLDLSFLDEEYLDTEKPQKNTETAPVDRKPASLEDDEGDLLDLSFLDDESTEPSPSEESLPEQPIQEAPSKKDQLVDKLDRVRGAGKGAAVGYGIGKVAQTAKDPLAFSSIGGGTSAAKSLIAESEKTKGFEAAAKKDPSIRVSDAPTKKDVARYASDKGIPAVTGKSDIQRTTELNIAARKEREKILKDFTKQNPAQSKKAPSKFLDNLKRNLELEGIHPDEIDKTIKGVKKDLYVSRPAYRKELYKEPGSIIDPSRNKPFEILTEKKVPYTKTTAHVDDVAKLENYKASKKWVQEAFGDQGSAQIENIVRKSAKDTVEELVEASPETYDALKNIRKEIGITKEIGKMTEQSIPGSTPEGRVMRYLKKVLPGKKTAAALSKAAKYAPAAGAVIGGISGAMAAEPGEELKGAAKGVKEALDPTDMVFGELSSGSQLSSSLKDFERREKEAIKQLPKDKRKEALSGLKDRMEKLKNRSTTKYAKENKNLGNRSQALSNASSDSLQNMISRIQKDDPSNRFIGPLESAMNAESPTKKNAIMFSLQQQPEFRQLLESFEKKNKGDKDE